MKKLYHDANIIINNAIKENIPQQAVRNAVKSHDFSGNIYLLAIGKAAWNMTHSAVGELDSKIKRGMIITKYGHSSGDIPGIEIIEAGHPLPNDNTVAGTKKAVEMAKTLKAEDELLFLVSGGGSALFEEPLEGLTLSDIIGINSQLLSCGADITEINMIRKRLSAVKAGRFAQICSPAKVFSIVLSDVLGNRLDSIASGPAAPDTSTTKDALSVIEKYKLNIGNMAMKCLQEETPKFIDNVKTVITGSVQTLCESAANIASGLGYVPHILCYDMNCEAREAGRLISSIAKNIDSGKYIFKRPCAVILGGETVVTLKGNGKGGRNQELALAAAEGIAGIDNLLIFSIGSDGTDGPTDAAGGIVDGSAFFRLKEKGMSLRKILDNNDSYNGLAAIDSLVITGPTGTNVNDVTVILCK